KPRLGLHATTVSPSRFSRSRRGLSSLPTRRSADLRRRRRPPVSTKDRTSSSPSPMPSIAREPWRTRYASRRRHSGAASRRRRDRSEEHTSELQSRENLVCRILLEKKKLLLPKARLV